MLDEHHVRYYTREEEFLDHFHMVAWEAQKLLGEDWHPESNCDDKIRKSREYFLKTGQLNGLVFDGAAIYHSSDGFFSSAQIILKSSTRVVNLRVRKLNDNKFAAEKILDKAVEEDKKAGG
jgi:hypothetical protein